MEIELRILYRPKRIWFFLLFYLCFVAMEIASTSPGDALHLSDVTFEPNENENITRRYPENSINAQAGNDTFEDDDCFFFNNSTFDDEECQAFFTFSPPPNFEDMPPPPLPPFLKEIELLFHASWERPVMFNYEEGQDGFVPHFEEGTCPLCQWSRGNNETLALLKRKPNDKTSKQDSNSVMVWILVGVALLSASIGAVLMGLFLRCRRKDVINICSKTSTDDNSNAHDSTEPPDRKKIKLSAFLFPFKNWGGQPPRTSLDPYRAESIQNTYSESPYINTDSSSTLYAEINTPTDVESTPPEGVLMCSHDAYSEVPDPVVVSSGMHVLYNKMPKVSKLGRTKSNNDGVYSNNAYIVSEASSEPSSGGSTSTPSSAYYSDVSTSVEIHVNKKRKKKRKNDEKIFRLAPSQKLRNHYLPTFRPQQIHALCSNGEQKFPEQTQNIFCSGNLVQDFVQRQNISSFDPVPGMVQNSVGIPPVSLQSTDVMLPLANDGMQKTMLNSIEGIPLCLHFGKVCSEQGRICRVQSHNHISNNISNNNSSNNIYTEQGQIYTDQYQLNDQNIPARYLINENIHHRHDLDKKFYSGQSPISENVVPGQGQLSRKVYALREKLKESICTEQYQINENVHSDLDQISEHAFSEQDYLAEAVYFGQNEINGNICPDHGQMFGNANFVQGQASENVYSQQDPNRFSVYYRQGQNKLNTFADLDNPCSNICVGQDVSDNLYPEQVVINENVIIRNNSIVRNVNCTDPRVCGQISSGRGPLSRNRVLRNGNISDIYTREGQLCENAYSGQDQLIKDAYSGQDHVSEDVYSGQGHVSENVYSGQGHVSEDVYSGQGHINEDVYPGQGHVNDNIYSGQGHISENTYSEQDLPSENVYSGEYQLSENINSEQGLPCELISGQYQLSNSVDSEHDQLSKNVPSSQCGINENYSDQCANTIIGEDIQRSLPFQSGGIIQEPQRMTKDQVQCFSPTPSEYI